MIKNQYCDNCYRELPQFYFWDETINKRFCHHGCKAKYDIKKNIKLGYHVVEDQKKRSKINRVEWDKIFKDKEGNGQTLTYLATLFYKNKIPIYSAYQSILVSYPNLNDKMKYNLRNGLSSRYSELRAAEKRLGIKTPPPYISYGN